MKGAKGTNVHTPLVGRPLHFAKTCHADAIRTAPAKRPSDTVLLDVRSEPCAINSLWYWKLRW